MIDISMMIDPPTATAQQKGERIVKGKYIHHYEKAKVKAARDLYREQLRPYVPEKPLDGAIQLRVVFYHYGKTKKPGWKTSKPDTDNMVKLLKDVMTQMGFWHDDSQVCYETVMKRWSYTPAVWVTVEKLEDE